MFVTDQTVSLADLPIEQPTCIGKEAVRSEPSVTAFPMSEMCHSPEVKMCFVLHML
jgi:hypothetical protein